jgi:hypothetical protein
MLVKSIAAAAFMLLPYNLDYLTLMAVIAGWLAWKIEEGRKFKSAEAVGNARLIGDFSTNDEANGC